MTEYLLILSLKEKMANTKKKHKQKNQELNPIRFPIQIQKKTVHWLFCLTDYNN